jgi:hypothetical protein
MFLLHMPRYDFIAGFFSQTHFRQRQLLIPFAEEEQLPRIERLVLGAIETRKQRGGRCVDSGLHSLLQFNPMHFLMFAQCAISLGNNLLQQRRTIRQLLRVQRRRNLRAHAL